MRTKEQAIDDCRKAKAEGLINEFFVDHWGISVRATEQDEFYPVWPEPEWDSTEGL